MIEEYKNLVKEVENFIDEVERCDEVQKSRVKYYKGAQILYSALHKNPKYMFIGINPGNGYFKQNNGKLLREFEIQDKLEYSKLWFKYPIARNTRKLFKLSGLTEYLEKSVKTNCYFLATTNEAELYKFMGNLKKIKAFEKVYLQSNLWLNKIIEIVEPQNIICEGKSAFLEFIKDKELEYIENEYILHTTYKKMNIIGYKRHLSHILHIDKVANYLQTKSI